MGIIVAELMVLSVNPHLVNQEAKSPVEKEKAGSLPTLSRAATLTFLRHGFASSSFPDIT